MDTRPRTDTRSHSTQPVPQAGCAAGMKNTRSLLGLADLSGAQLQRLLWRARELSPVAIGKSSAIDLLGGRTVATAFFEPSTRTRLSFTLAAQRLGAAVIDLAASRSSISKGESMVDTARTLEAMGVDAIVMRTTQAGAAHLVSRSVSCPVVNAGDGKHAHPTQGLLDIAALAQATDRFDSLDLAGLCVAIVGDIVSSRVARSAIAGMTALGAKVTLVGPAHLVPASMTTLAREPGTVTIERTLEAVLEEADAIMLLRIQFERHAGNPARASQRTAPIQSAGVHAAGPIASIRHYRDACALTRARAARMKPGAVLMHPGPVNRGLEIDSELVDDPRSLIASQVAWGLAVRAAALEACMHLLIHLA